MEYQSKQDESADYSHSADDLKYMNIALNEARKSPPKPTNFCIGACLVAFHPEASKTELLVSGYTLECEGNTHAEQCCFIKLAAQCQCPESELGLHLPGHTWLYTTMEPCNNRSVGNTPCVDRILSLRRADGGVAIEKVFVGVVEPVTFVSVNQGRQRLEDAGIEVVKVGGLDKEILKVAKAGH